jgi:hypothetical protein
MLVHMLHALPLLRGFIIYEVVTMGLVGQNGFVEDGSGHVYVDVNKPHVHL